MTTPKTIYVIFIVACILLVYTAYDANKLAKTVKEQQVIIQMLQDQIAVHKEVEKIISPETLKTLADLLEEYKKWKKERILILK